MAGDPGLGQQGVLQVIPPAALEQQLQQQATAKAQANQPQQAPPVELVGYIRTQFEIMRNHRNTNSGWSERLLQSLRAFNGQYDATKLQAIKQFGGSEVYARIIAQKCRAASSLLRDIYLGQDRPWSVRPPSNPDVPPQIVQAIDQLMQQEAQMVTQQLGRPPQNTDMQKRKTALLESASDAAKKKASQQARDSEDKIEDMLRSGGFYTAFAEFLIDLPIFPFAVLKGPVVKVIPTVTWPDGGGQPTVQQKPTLTWNRVSPFDLWFTPGVADIENANCIEKLRITRAELNDLLDLPGYNTDEIRAVLDEYGRGGLYDNWDTTDAERAVLENRENPAWNRSLMLSMMEFNGNIQGRVLQDYGLAVPDELRDYAVQCWVIGNHVIKVHLSPSPRQRHPYFITSYEKTPGSPVGNSLVDLLSDVQESANATLRSLINNLSIASGPQVVVDDDRIVPGQDNDSLYAWKRWHTRSDPVGNNAKPPVSFFMPTSNSNDLIMVYKYLVEIADDVSAIPKYVGGGSSGGAGRTASGLAMLMGNASKILQTVSANIDRDVMEPCLLQLSDLIMLTDTTGLLTGEEKISVQGVSVAVQRETLRQRQIEFAQATMNPTDMKIIGIKGRGGLLRSISSTLGMQGEEIVPPEDVLERLMEQEKQQQQSGPMAQVVEKGVQAGVEAGVKRIATELTAGELAMHEQMPEGPPAHVGTPPGASDPDMDLGSEGNQPTQGGAEHMAAQGQGNQPPRPGKGMAPQTHLTGNQPAGPPGGKLTPGVG
jgi:chemotaxis regulatin CheY-phosphate phosphatase CheZ